jgi:3-oxoacyl-[acyl-carrier-protein] synthase II
MALMRQSLGKRLSCRNDDPPSACRPFAAGRDGTVISEGGGLVILEELEHAKARGARVYCELVGFGASHAAADPNPLKPPVDGRGVALAIRKALKHAAVDGKDVGLVSACAGGLPEADASEAAALRTVLGDQLPKTPVMAIKGGLGNSGAGSGAIDFIAAALAVYNQTIPPALNCEPQDPALGLKLSPKGPVDARVEVAISNGYALRGGQNATLVIRRYRG